VTISVPAVFQASDHVGRKRHSGDQEEGGEALFIWKYPGFCWQGALNRVVSPLSKTEEQKSESRSFQRRSQRGGEGFKLESM